MTAGARGRLGRIAAAATIPALTFAVALGVLAVSAPLSASAGAASTECAWQRHSKRVVKHVKRHGKPKKVVRIKHYWTCNPVPAPASPIPPPLQPPPTPTPPPPAEPQPQPEPKANAVGVIADDAGGEFRYTVLAEEPHAGPLTVQLQNRGEDPHNLNIQTVGPAGAEGEPVASIGNTAPQAQSTAVFELPPGEYRLFCSIGEHAKKGMETTLVVK